MNENDVSTNTLLYMNMLDSFCRHGHSSLLPEVCSPLYWHQFLNVICKRSIFLKILVKDDLLDQLVVFIVLA